MNLTKNVSKLPVGMYILIITILIEILREIYSYFRQFNLFFGTVQTGIYFNIINTIMILFSVFAVLGLITISKNMMKFTVVYFCLMIANYTLVIFNSQALSTLTKLNRNGIIFLHSAGILLILLSIWYLYEKKTLFLHKKDDNKSVDAFFLATYTIIFFSAILLSAVFTN